MTDETLMLPETVQELTVLEGKTAWALRLAKAIIIAGFIAALVPIVLLSTSSEDIARAGSYLGGTTVALWSLAGLLMIYAAFLGQRHQIIQQAEDLRLNRLELQRTIEQLAGQREAMELQNVAIYRQEFETTFFQLLRLHHDIVSALRISEKYDGRAGFKVVYNYLKAAYQTEASRSAGSLEASQRAYESIYTRHEASLGHYFRNLYHIVKFVDQSPVTDKRRYTALIRAQLSSYELILLFFNCLSPHGIEKFKPLLERFALLHTLPMSLLPDRGLSGLYSSAAYDAEESHIGQTSTTVTPLKSTIGRNDV